MEQQEAIWQSVPIGEFKNGVYLYNCYQLDSFFIETKRHIELDVLHGLRSFTNPDLLAPYLDKINLNGL